MLYHAITFLAQFILEIDERIFFENKTDRLFATIYRLRYSRFFLFFQQQHNILVQEVRVLQEKNIEKPVAKSVSARTICG